MKSITTFPGRDGSLLKAVDHRNRMYFTKIAHYATHALYKTVVKQADKSVQLYIICV